MTVGLSTTIGIPPSHVPQVTKQAARMGTKLEIVYDDLQTLVKHAIDNPHILL